MLRRRSAHSAAFLLAVFACYLGVLLVVGWATGAVAGGDRDNLPLWIARNLSRDWLNRPAALLGGGSNAASDAQLSSFFSETSTVAATERELAVAEVNGSPADSLQQALRAQLRDTGALSRPVEIRLSDELSRTAVEAGMTTALPIYDGVVLVWPPVAFALDFPPLVLARSPRDRIELDDANLLRGDLSAEAIKHIEARAESKNESALVVRIGGLAAYPSLVENDDDYDDTLEVIAHEWTHQYLAFHPLGVRYFESLDMTTINETVANVVSLELAAMIRTANPAPPSARVVQSNAPPPDPAIDFDRTMHDLRLEVDALLAQGNVSAAEQRMNATRDFLNQHGYAVRTINQAYFAFYGTYANTPQSSSPLGPELTILRSRYASLRSFVRAVQNVRSPADLQRLLKSSSGSAGGRAQNGASVNAPRGTE